MDTFLQARVSLDCPAPGNTGHIGQKRECCSPGWHVDLPVSGSLQSGRCVHLLPYISPSEKSFLLPSFHIFGLFQSGV